ncbi:MAG: type II toxin-antitoxin system ParD family antitoxin [Pseudomonadota bacterium]
MPRNTSVTLGDHFASFVDRSVESGRYQNASDVVRAGLRLLEEHETKVTALRQALVAGEQSGEAAPLDIDAFIAGKTGGV